MLYLKTFETALLAIARHLHADLGPAVDLVEGSVTRSLAEAVAFQAADISERQERSIMAAIPEAVFTTFDFARIPAQPSTGTLEFYTSVPARDVILIPAGTEVMDDDETVYATTEDAYLVPGGIKVSAPAKALEGGIHTNAPALSITRLASGIPGLTGVRNPAPFAGGANIEAAAARRTRFQGYLASLDRSSRAGLLAAAQAAHVNNIRADSVLVLDCDNDPDILPGAVLVLLYRRGGVPGTLLGTIRGALDRTRAAGILVQAEAVPGTPVNVRVSVDCADPEKLLTVQAAVRQALGAYFAGLRFGQKASYENVITVATTAHALVDEVSVTLNGAQLDVPAAPRQRLELGELVVA